VNALKMNNKIMKDQFEESIWYNEAPNPEIKEINTCCGKWDEYGICNCE